MATAVKFQVKLRQMSVRWLIPVVAALVVTAPRVGLSNRPRLPLDTDVVAVLPAVVTGPTVSEKRITGLQKHP